MWFCIDFLPDKCISFVFYFCAVYMKICSRNVNGIRAVMNKWFQSWLEKENPDILCLQETKAFEHQMPPELKYMMREYQYVRHSWTRPGYAGTAIFYKDFPEHIEVTSVFDDIPEFYEDGRVTQLTVNGLVLLNIYFPNGWARANGDDMLWYKLKFYDKFIAYCDSLVSQGKKVIACGDYNICHKEIDIARPKENANSIWFLPEERAKVDQFVSHGYVDAFRHLHGDVLDRYTRRSYRAGARPRNVWRRIDYFFVSENLKDSIIDCIQQDGVQGSDHCPVSLTIAI